MYLSAATAIIKEVNRSDDAAVLPRVRASRASPRSRPAASTFAARPLPVRFPRDSRWPGCCGHAPADPGRCPDRGRRHRRQRGAHAHDVLADPVGHHRRPGVAEVREPAVHRLLQGPRRAQPAPAAHRRRADARRRRHVGRQPRPGRRLPRRPPRHPRHHRHAPRHALREGGATPRRSAPRWCSRATTIDEATTKAAELAEAHGLVSVHPFDDLYVIAGQGTVALEMLEDAPDLEVIVVPIGGGGLIAGMAIAAKRAGARHRDDRRRDRLYPSMLNAAAGHARRARAGRTIAEGIAVPTPGVLTAPIVAGLRRARCCCPRGHDRAGRQPLLQDREDRGRRRRRRRAGGAAPRAGAVQGPASRAW